MDYELGSVCLLNLCKDKSGLCKCLSLSTVNMFCLQVYSWHLYNINYIHITHHIQHCYCISQTQGHWWCWWSGTNAAPVPSKWDIDTLRWEFSTGPGCGHWESLPHTYSHSRYERPQKYSPFLLSWKITIFGHQGNTLIPVWKKRKFPILYIIRGLSRISSQINKTMTR